MKFVFALLFFFAQVSFGAYSKPPIVTSILAAGATGSGTGTFWPTLAAVPSGQTLHITQIRAFDTAAGNTTAYITTTSGTTAANIVHVVDWAAITAVTETGYATGTGTCCDTSSKVYTPHTEIVLPGGTTYYFKITISGDYGWGVSGYYTTP